MESQPRQSSGRRLTKADLAEMNAQLRTLGLLAELVVVADRMTARGEYESVSKALAGLMADLRAAKPEMVALVGELREAAR